MDRFSFYLWESWTRIKHAFGIHSFIPNEEWDFTEEVVTLRGEVCWLCPKRRS